MLEFFKNAFSALPVAASSPFSFIAYLALIVAWVIISVRVKRNNQLLGSLKKLPVTDRLKALQMEMGTVEVAAGLTPEQWLRSRIHNYYFWGFAILCLVAVIIFAIAATTKKIEPGTANVDVTLFEEQIMQTASDSLDQKFGVKESKSKPTSHAAKTAIEPKDVGDRPPLLSIKMEEIKDDTKTQFGRDGEPDFIVLNEYDGSGGDLPYKSEELTLTYGYDRVDEKIVIQPIMPYLSLLARGGPIKAFRYWWSPFQWQFPKLSVKIVNNTTRTLFLTEAIVKVNHSKINLDPVIIVEENDIRGHVTFINEGWGKVLDPTIEFGVLNIKEFDGTYPSAPIIYSIAFDTFLESAYVSILDHVPPDLKNEEYVCVFGRVRYNMESSRSHEVKFSTLVYLGEPRAGAPLPPNYLYDLFLEAGKFGYTKRVPIAQEIKAGEVDHFIIRLGTDKSASFDLSFSFRATDNVELVASSVLLHVFLPRSQKGYIDSQESGAIRQ